MKPRRPKLPRRTPEEQAFAASAKKAILLIVDVVHDAVAQEQKRCVAIIREYLQFNDQRAVSWHEVNDAIERIEKGHP
jgi:hypothetical protein